MNLKFRIIIIFFCSSSVFSQESNPVVDSLQRLLKTAKNDTTKIDIYSSLSQNYQYLDSKLGLEYANKALILSKKIKWSRGLANAYSTLGINYSVQGNNEKAIALFKESLKFCGNNKKATGKILKNIGSIYNRIGKYELALTYNYKALQISEEINDKENIAKVITNIGNIYYYLKNTEKAIACYNKSLIINKELKNKLGVCKNLQNIGSTYILKKQDEKARGYFDEAAILCKKIDDQEGLMHNYYNIGTIEFNTKNYDKALYNYQISKTIADEIGNYELTNSTSVKEAEIYLIQYKITKDKSFLAKAEKLSLMVTDNDHFNEDILLYRQKSQLLSEIYEENKDYKNSLKYYKDFFSANDSLYNSESKETIKNLEDKRTIDLRNKEIQLNKVTLESQKKQKWFFISGILLLGIIGGLLFYQNRNRKKTNEKLQTLNTELDEANKAKTRFFSILNHDLRGPVANLVSFLLLQKESPEMLDEESTKRMQDKTMEGAENLLNSMEDILQWSKSQMENFKPQPKKILISTLFDDITNHFSSEEKVKISLEIPENMMLKTDENYLKTIIRNLTGNAIKALAEIENPSIIWKAWQQDNQTFLSITDNGSGASQEQFKALYDDKAVASIKTGLGLHLIRDLAKAIDCKITVDTKENSGTTFTLVLT